MSSKNKLFSGIIWSVLAKVGSQGLSIISVMVLARFISPAEYGIIALTAIAIGFATTAINFGVKPILIKIDNLKKVQIDSFFWFYFGLALTACLVLYSLATWLSSYYGVDEVRLATYIMALAIPLNAFTTVQIGLVTKSLKFKELGKVKVFAQFVGFLMVLLVLFLWEPIYALAMQPIWVAITTMILLSKPASWFPSFKVDFGSIKQEFRFGSVLFFNNIFSYISRQLDNLLVGKNYGESELGVYQRAYSFIMIPTKFVSESLVKVLNPFYVLIKDDRSKIGRYYLLCYRLTSVFLAALLLPICIEPSGFIQIVFGKDWIEMAPYLAIFAISGYLQGTNSLSGPILLSLAEVKLLRNEIILKRGFLILGIVLAINYGVYFVALARLASDVFNKLINAFQMKSSISLSFKQQLTNFFKSHSASIALFGLLFCSHYLIQQTGVMLAIQFVILFVISLIATYIFLVVVKPSFILLLLEHIKQYPAIARVLSRVGFSHDSKI